MKLNDLIYDIWTVMLNLLVGLAVCKELDEKRLHHDLFGNNRYHKVVKPTMKDSILLTVNLGLRLSQLLDMVSV